MVCFSFFGGGIGMEIYFFFKGLGACLIITWIRELSKFMGSNRKDGESYEYHRILG